MRALDTNTLIYFFKGQGQVVEHLLQHPPQEIAIPTVVLYELEVGINKSSSPDKRRKQLHELISLTHLLAFDHKAAGIAAQIRSKLEKDGSPIGSYDILIAATAMSNDAILVSHNVKEFSKVEGLLLEDWY
ncbi:MAG: tRNA(fMet)-specific endonuclease VapC [Gammaproteobacteria bacterium]|jgi:tRNA(fMet)-specific endonuclease VapC